MKRKVMWWTWFCWHPGYIQFQGVTYPETQKMSLWLTCDKWLTEELYTLKAYSWRILSLKVHQQQFNIKLYRHCTHLWSRSWGVHMVLDGLQQELLLMCDQLTPFESLLLANRRLSKLTAHRDHYYPFKLSLQGSQTTSHTCLMK